MSTPKFLRSQLFTAKKLLKHLTPYERNAIKQTFEKKKPSNN